MCLWFPTSELPFAFGIQLFLVKTVRAINDNVASMFYEAHSKDYTPEDGKNVSTDSLLAYFKIGFVICIFSNVCSLILTTIHMSVIDNSSHPQVKEKEQE